MVWCVFRASFLSNNERDKTVPTIEDILTTDTFQYQFINVTWYTEAATKSDEFLGELVTKHIRYLNDAFYYIHGYFNVERPESLCYNYRDLINITHNIQ